MDRVIIGVDPSELSVTIEARDNREILRATGRFGTDTRSYRQLLDVARQWPQRDRAPAGAAALADGERLLDVPAKLAARGPRVRYRPGTQDRRYGRARHRDGRAAR
jgi:transposase